MTKYIIKRLTPDLLEDYFDFFDNRAFSDGSPFYPCYCNAFNMSRERIQDELYEKASEYGGEEGWKRALRESAMRMVELGEIQGYLAYDKGTAIGWCNSNDRMNYYRVGEFDLSHVPQDERCDDCQNEGEIKSIVCFEISPEYRGKGIASALLNRICKDAELDGYSYVEAYPMISESTPDLAFTGPKRLYEKAGFRAVEQRKHYLVMRKNLK